MLGCTTFNVGGLGQATALQPIWRFTPREVVHRAWTATVRLVADASPYDPIASVIAGPPLAARVAEVDILGAPHLLPVGIAGPRWFTRTAMLRYR